MRLYLRKQTLRMPESTGGKTAGGATGSFFAQGGRRIDACGAAGGEQGRSRAG